LTIKLNISILKMIIIVNKKIVNIILAKRKRA